MKLLKRTLNICILCFILTLILSIVFKFLEQFSLNLFSYLTNLMLGIACSLIVAIITTYVQYKDKQNEYLVGLSIDIFTVFIKYDSYCELFSDKIFSKEQLALISETYIKYDESIQKILDILYEYSSYSTEKNNAIKNIFNELRKISKQINNGELTDLSYANLKKYVLIH